MKFYSLVTERNEIVGYRVETKSNRLYDISIDLVPSLPIIGEIHGSISQVGRDKLFTTGLKDTVTELKENDIKISVLKELYGDHMEPFSLFYGDAIRKMVAKYSNYVSRGYVKKVTALLLEKNSYDLYELYGVRRTGKTVSMFHIMKGLLDEGVSLEDICYISLKEDKCMSGGRLEELLTFFSEVEHVKYLFVDEITFVSDDFRFLVNYGNGFEYSKVIVAGTNSSVFIIPNLKELYDRSKIVKTSSISFWEYHTLYPKSTIIDYIKSGGLLLKSSKEGYVFDEDYDTVRIEDDDTCVDKDAEDYLRTSIYNNIIGGLERYSEFSDMYGGLYNVYIHKDGKKHLLTFIYKLAQKYSYEIVVSSLLESFKSTDIGSMFDLYGKDILTAENKIGSMSDEDRLLLNKNTRVLSQILSSIFKDKLMVVEDKDITVEGFDEILDNIMNVLTRIGCLRRDLYPKIVLDVRGEKVGDVKADYFMPLLIRYGLAIKVIKVLNRNWEEFCDKAEEKIEGINREALFNSKELMINDTESSIEGLLCEEVIRYTLNGIREGCAGKFMSKLSGKYGVEIDILYKDDMIEVKRSSEVYPYQAKWLLSSYFLSKDKYKNRRRVLLTNRDDDCVVHWSERDALISLKENCERRGTKVSKWVIDRLNSDDATLDMKQDIHCLNMTRYLLDSCKQEIVAKRNREKERE